MSAEPSVAMAQANIFSINGYSVPNKIAKILIIFDRIGPSENFGMFHTPC